jgi:TATA-box binding protein (TBP) (component of TFIID and TFIIIB)
MNIDDEWEQFCNGTYDDKVSNICNESCSNPICGDLYISTITKLAYLDVTIPLNEIFWGIPMISYHEQREGIIKKEMKFNCNTLSEFETLQGKIPSQSNMVMQQIITHIDNPDGRIKFKDSRKISVGICKKDILSTRARKKGAFYNCFVMIMRIKSQNDFKDIHVKIFNTGNIKIPGIQSDEMFETVVKNIITILNKFEHFANKPVKYLEDRTQIVLINSNFNCGFFVNREKLYTIIKKKYGLNCSYDPCSYPGIHIEYYYKDLENLQDQTGKYPHKSKDNITHVHIKVFRTGSCLILGKSSCHIIENVYMKLKHIFETECQNII